MKITLIAGILGALVISADAEDLDYNTPAVRASDTQQEQQARVSASAQDPAAAAEAALTKRVQAVMALPWPAYTVPGQSVSGTTSDGSVFTGSTAGTVEYSFRSVDQQTVWNRAKLEVEAEFPLPKHPSSVTVNGIHSYMQAFHVVVTQRDERMHQLMYEEPFIRDTLRANTQVWIKQSTSDKSQGDPLSLDRPAYHQR